jgi:hypothetical protein
VDLSLIAAATSVSGLQGFNGDPFGPSVVAGTLTETHFLDIPGPTPGLAVVQTDTSSTAAPVPVGSSLPITFDLPAASAGPVTLTSPSDLQFFIDGDITLFARGGFSAEVIPPSASTLAIIGFPSTPVNVTATLTYTFTPVPEPSSLTLVGVVTLGLLACGWGRRRARQAP